MTCKRITFNRFVFLALCMWLAGAQGAYAAVTAHGHTRSGRPRTTYHHPLSSKYSHQFPSSSTRHPLTPPLSNPNWSAASSYDHIQVERSDFGVVTDRSGPTKNWKLHPVVVIPNLPGIQYAWKLKVKPHNPVFVREVFTLPEAPSSWKIKQDETSSELLKGGEQCVLENFQATDDGWIGHSWTASRGDPAGSYEIKIWLNGKLAHTFVFNVGEPGDLSDRKRDL